MPDANDGNTGSAGAGAAGGEGSADETKLKAAADAGANSGGDEGEGDFSDPEKAKAEIKKLRAENAKHRTKNKSLETEFGAMKETVGKLKQALGIEGDDADPEKQIASLKAQNEALQFETAVGEICREQDIPRASEKYFKFLLAQEFDALEEGEEITEERIIEIAAEAKKLAPAAAQSSTGLNNGNKPPPAGSANDISVAQFVKMNSGERSQIYVKNPNLYNKLFEEAKEKRLL